MIGISEPNVSYENFMAKHEEQIGGNITDNMMYPRAKHWTLCSYIVIAPSNKKLIVFYKGISTLSTYQVKVPFRDVDMHGHVHNSAYMSYFEEAITDWIEQNKFVSDINPMTSEHRFFIKKIELTYHLPAHFNRRYEIKVSLRKLGNTSITIHCEMYDQSQSDPKLIVEEDAVWVYVDKAGIPATIASPLRDKLEALL